MSEFPLPARHWTPREEIVLRISTGSSILPDTPQARLERLNCPMCRSGRCLMHMTEIDGIPASIYYLNRDR